MDRPFMVKSETTKRFHCCACGKVVPGNAYGFRKHMELAHQVQYVDAEMTAGFQEDKDYGYRLSKVRGALRFEICTPQLVLRPGFQDEYMGATWKPIYVLDFLKNSRNPVERMNNSTFPLEVWLALIRQGKVVRIHERMDLKIIHSVFPMVLDLDHLQMFVHIYKNKGYRYDPPSKEVEGELFLEMEYLEPSEPDCELEIRTFSYPDRMFLGVKIFDHGDDDIFLFSKDYVACNHTYAYMSALFSDSYRTSEVSWDELDRFSSRYPELMLHQMDDVQIHTLFQILLSGYYHSGMELCAKSGLCHLVTEHDKLKVFRQDPSLYRNVKELFGLPVKYLKKVHRYDVSGRNLKILKELYAYNPQFLDMEGQYRQEYYQFAHRVDLTKNNHQADIFLENVKDKDKLRMLRYANQVRNVSGRWDFQHLYMDYLRMCELMGQGYPYGVVPKNVREAHDRMARDFVLLENKWKNARFMEVVQQERYASLTTLREEDREDFDKHPYMIMAPACIEDITQEGQHMHNCVASYSDSVMRNNCRIYFMRDKEKPNESLGTIEVRRNAIVQAKGKYNRRLLPEEINFVKYWAMKKGLSIKTYDV